jgi:DNA mismatch repair protein MutS2
MLKKTMATLEYKKIIEKVVGNAATSLGKEESERLEPKFNLDEVDLLQQETDDALTCIRLKGTAPFGGISDIRGAVKRAQIGGVLSGSECFSISSLLYGVRQLHRYFEDILEGEENLETVRGYYENLILLSSLEKKITATIDESGDVYDDASPTLRALRISIRNNENRVREQLEGMLRNSSTQKMLSDVLVTIRNNRYVIPVKQEYRASFGGIVHDQSSSGATLFIEPERVVNLNNELSQLRIKEQIEIEKILRELSANIAEFTSEILSNVSLVSKIDFVFARAKFSRQIKGSRPILNEEGYINLKKARHPLIDSKDVVANNIVLGRDYDFIIITGPNTGGKTVTLKTVGLCVLMAQSGLQIPANEQSEVSIFEYILADIGDEQSIEQSLSTFSSHMVNIVRIFEIANFRSLVLFDELGAGTDPQEGAALAIAIIEEMKARGSKGIATTHYAELKAYAFETEGITNANVEFDVQTLSPTYKLRIGTPGKSNAFEISKRLGLPDRVLNIAKQQVGEDTRSVENMIVSLHESQINAEKLEERANILKQEAEQLKEKWEGKMSNIEEEREKLLFEAELKIESELRRAREEADSIITNLRKLQKSSSDLIKEHELIDARKGLQEASPNLTKGLKKTITKKTNIKLEPGDEVKILSLNQKGNLVEKVSDREWYVQVGILKVKIKTDDIEKLKSVNSKPQRSVTTVKGSGHHVSIELDLRGERYEDAMNRLEKYIDSALLAGYPRVSIIHGHGTGALRKGVQEFLKRHRHVKATRFGEGNEGGVGVTIAELK